MDILNSGHNSSCNVLLSGIVLAGSAFNEYVDSSFQVQLKPIHFTTVEFPAQNVPESMYIIGHLNRITKFNPQLDRINFKFRFVRICEQNRSKIVSSTSFAVTSRIKKKWSAWLQHQLTFLICARPVCMPFSFVFFLLVLVVVIALGAIQCASREWEHTKFDSHSHKSKIAVFRCIFLVCSLSFDTWNKSQWKQKWIGKCAVPNETIFRRNNYEIHRSYRSSSINCHITVPNERLLIRQLIVTYARISSLRTMRAHLRTIELLLLHIQNSKDERC